MINSVLDFRSFKTEWDRLPAATSSQTVVSTTEQCRTTFSPDELVTVRRALDVTLHNDDLAPGQTYRVRQCRPFNGQIMVYLYGFKRPFCACCFKSASDEEVL